VHVKVLQTHPAADYKSASQQGRNRFQTDSLREPTRFIEFPPISAPEFDSGAFANRVIYSTAGERAEITQNFHAPGVTDLSTLCCYATISTIL